LDIEPALVPQLGKMRSQHAWPKDPSRRPQSAEEVAQRLQRCLKADKNTKEGPRQELKQESAAFGSIAASSFSRLPAVLGDETAGQTGYHRRWDSGKSIAVLPFRKPEWRRQAQRAHFRIWMENFRMSSFIPSTRSLAYDRTSESEFGRTSTKRLLRRQPTQPSTRDHSTSSRVYQKRC